MQNKGLKQTESLVPARFREARISRGYSLSDLADLIGVSSQAISQIELGTSKPSMEKLVKMSDVLGFPINFFIKPKPNVSASSSATYFRSMKSTPKKLKDAFACRVEWANEVYQYLKTFIDFPKVDLPDFSQIMKDDNLDYENIEEVALSLRKHWGIEKGPIQNMVELLQEKGFVISNVEFKNRKIEAFSKWHDNVPFIIMGSDKDCAARSRFSLAHELGHLIMHSRYTDEMLKSKAVLDQIEDEAHYFAGAFLLPANSFPNEVISNSIDQFILLKKRWKVSIQAMVMRCHKLNLFNDNQVRYIYAKLSSKGYRSREPLDDVLPVEKPYLFKQAFELLLENNIVPPEEIIDEIAHEKSEIDSLYFLPENLLSIQNRKPRLTLIKSE